MTAPTCYVAPCACCGRERLTRVHVAEKVGRSARVCNDCGRYVDLHGAFPLVRPDGVMDDGVVLGDAQALALGLGEDGEE